MGVHLLQDSFAALYDPPRQQRGRSDVGFGGSKARVESRLNMLRRAFREGHEIAGHGNGHWDGSEFTYEDWASELRQFDYFFRNAYEINGIVDPDDLANCYLMLQEQHRSAWTHELDLRPWIENW